MGGVFTGQQNPLGWRFRVCFMTKSWGWAMTKSSGRSAVARFVPQGAKGWGALTLCPDTGSGVVHMEVRGLGGVARPPAPRHRAGERLSQSGHQSGPPELGLIRKKLECNATIESWDCSLPKRGRPPPGGAAGGLCGQLRFLITNRFELNLFPPDGGVGQP